MFHIDVIKDGDVSKVKSQTLVDGQMYVDEKPRAGSTNPVTSDGVVRNINSSTKNTLDDKDPADTTIEFKTDAEGAAAYDEGYYFLLGDKIYLTDSITNEGAVYTITATKKNGVIPVINSLVARIAALEEGE